MAWPSCFRPCPTMPGMTDNDRLERFADLIVCVGANVQPGSFVLLRSDIAHLEIARAVAERAYVAGASWVEVDSDPAFAAHSRGHREADQDAAMGD